ncbi:MAG TPA: helix-turn-helix domain-containing protein [Gaiellaceae bacterium]|nr:helix-turn-helix domain-containing protein [Gaiellaceae bacterium]
MATATTGIPELDDALGGVLWGDNVVLEAEDPAAHEPFYAAAAESADRYDSAVYVAVESEPDEVRSRFPALDVLDARAQSPLARPGALVQALRRAATPSTRDLVLFDPLETMTARWGAEIGARFFTRACPLLLQLGAIAYWSVRPASLPQRLRREIESVTQCVVVLADGRLRVAKAEGRRPGVEGGVFRYGVEDGRPVLAAAPAAARLGTALQAIRKARRLSQGDLARLAGVSASAISQAERGRRGLSLETLVELSAKLGITIDELLRGDLAPGYRLGRRDRPPGREEGRPWPLLDDPRAGLRAYTARLAPGEAGAPRFPHKGVELVAVGSGLVQVELPTGRPVLRGGEALLAEASGVTGWRNLGESEAVLFWVLRDEART